MDNKELEQALEDVDQFVESLIAGSNDCGCMNDHETIEKNDEWAVLYAVLVEAVWRG